MLGLFGFKDCAHLVKEPESGRNSGTEPHYAESNMSLYSFKVYIMIEGNAVNGRSASWDTLLESRPPIEDGNHWKNFLFTDSQMTDHLRKNSVLSLKTLLREY